MGRALAILAGLARAKAAGRRCVRRRDVQIRGNGRFDLVAEGTFTSASPSSTISSPTLQVQVSCALAVGNEFGDRHGRPST